MNYLMILSLVILCPMPALIGYNLGRQAGFKQTDRALAAAEEWKALHDKAAKTRDEALKLLQQTK